ncbi:hypothetical protein CERSUDRAFT_72086 [Gelatoporia subvermispora B]|uniref:F-box domain-containing protein n=1 Tax=Ceriporiopsis subvermispora (strain B) TaxID=914234 RepID=M2RIZ8_CERS8|nr:hypothetical protein CERSUDRAFT_72086 [Gelatoporia subvermispora B]
MSTLLPQAPDGDGLSTFHTVVNHHQQHRVLGNPDVWLLIFDELEDVTTGADAKASVRKATLASVAHVSKVVSEPALDALWRHLPGLRTFAAILSGWHQERGESSAHTEILVHAPVPKDRSKNQSIHLTPDTILAKLFSHAQGLQNFDFETNQHCFAQDGSRIQAYTELTTIRLASSSIVFWTPALVVTTTLLEALAALPALTTLVLDARHFDIAGPRVVKDETLMSIIDAPSLISIRFCLMQADNIAHARSHLEMLVKYYPRTLSELTSSFGMGFEGDTSLDNLLAPLRAFTKLTKLSCDLLYPFDVTFFDRDVRMLGEAWPQMKHLRLFYPQHAKPSLSAHCFIPFTRHFPHLESLALCVVDLTSDIPSTQDIAIHRQLKSLTIRLISGSTTEGTKLRAFAKLLFAIYPHVPHLLFSTYSTQGRQRVIYKRAVAGR